MESDWDKTTVLHKRGLKASDLKSKQAINQVCWITIVDEVHLNYSNIHFWIKAMKSGAEIDTTKKFNAATNKHAGTTLNAAKLDNETEQFRHNHVSMDVSKLIASQRQKLGLTQKVTHRLTINDCIIWPVLICFLIFIKGSCDQDLREAADH